MLVYWVYMLQRHVKKLCSDNRSVSAESVFLCIDSNDKEYRGPYFYDTEGKRKN